MKEDFLYHLWKFQKFESEELKTSEGERLKIIHPGFQNDLSGPDFFNARIQIGEQLWAGNVELHLKSSDWYLHQHETDLNYDNVILHVVWEHDGEIYRKDASPIPTLELSQRIDPQILERYQNLLQRKHLKLNCENDFPGYSAFQIDHWLERLYFERLEVKSGIIHKLLAETGNNWEATLFIMLARSFGLNVNADAFMQMAQSIDFKIIRKLEGNLFSMEALFLGQAGLIKPLDQYGIDLEAQYQYLKNKYSLKNEGLTTAQFFRLRPDNFPTVRLAQLAALYAQRRDIFYAMMQAEDLQQINSILDIELSAYWKSHYAFGKSHSARNKKLTSSFISLLIVNCIVPVTHSYARYLGQENEKTVQNLLLQLKPEKNSLIDIFNDLKPGITSNAMHAQALLHLRKEYCNVNRCLHCELGASLLRKSPKYI